MKIAISGKSGCGNTSVSRLVAEKLGLTMINYTFRSMADELGISFSALCRLAESDDQYDLRLDSRQVELAAAGECVLGSRLAIWMVKDADLKIFLEADPTVRAGRISKRENRPLKEVLSETLARDARDAARYLRIYGIDHDDYRFADLVVDTNGLDQYDTAEIIVDRIRELI